MPPVITTNLSYETDIKPMFRPEDRQAKLDQYDLWSWWSVRNNADQIFKDMNSNWLRQLDKQSLKNFQVPQLSRETDRTGMEGWRKT